jgi:PAS domain S-box-containing protein
MRESFTTVMVDAIPGLVSWVDSDLNYLAVNSALAALFGLEPPQVVGKRVGFLGKDENPAFARELTAFFKSPQQKWHFEFSVASVNGERFFGVWAQKYENSTRAVLIGIDITERKLLELEAEVTRSYQFQTAKLVSLGEMAASIGHEINNPLAIVTAHASKLQTLASREADSGFAKIVQTSAEKIAKTALRISKIVGGLKNFSRDGREDPIEVVRVSSILEDALELCKGRASNAGVEIQGASVSDDLMVACRPVQLTQVVVNLVSNAVDAGEGRSSTWVRVEVGSKGSAIVFKVVDSGNGIPKEIREKLMNPFFTTKPRGKGTGLGLSISHNIVVSLGGSLEIDHAAPNTTFIISLPSAISGQKVA